MLTNRPSGRKKSLDALIGPNVLPQHRAFLEAALTQTSSREFNELLASMPNVGEDSDFARSKGYGTSELSRCFERERL